MKPRHFCIPERDDFKFFTRQQCVIVSPGLDDHSLGAGTPVADTKLRDKWVHGGVSSPGRTSAWFGTPLADESLEQQHL